MRIGCILLFLAVSLVTRAQVVINEVCAANGDIVYDSTFYNFSAWVEILNNGNSAIDISGYHLSDSTDYTTRWSFPPGTVIKPNQFILVWCDKRNVGLHTNFGIEPRGGQVVLSAPSGERIEVVQYPNQYFNISFARNGSAWNYTESPTPGAVNIAGTATTLLPGVEFGLPSGRYTAGILLTLANSIPGGEIRFTTDGSEPTRQSALFTAGISITQTQVVKAKAFHPDFLPSQTTLATYFIDEHDFSLPVVSLSGNPQYFFDNTIGIYVQGTNGLQKYCSTSPANWNQDWDRHGTFEYLKPTGESVYNQHLNFQLAGNCTRRRAQKTLAVKAKQEFGSGKIKFPFFDSKPIQKYDEVFLRNAGNDNNVTHFRDALLQTLPQGLMDVDYLAYQPSILYINGQYWGIQNLREKGNGDYIENNFGISEDDIDLLENYNSVVKGTKTAWFDFLEDLEQLDPLSPTTFQFVEQRIDVQEYINYLVLQTYYANTDWPNNIKFWRQRSTNGKFRWILWDLDFGFGLFPDQSDATHPTLEYITAIGSTDENDDNFTEPIRLMLAIPEFKNRFIATMATSLGTTFAPDRVVNVINQFSNRLQAEMPFHKQRWGGTVDNWNTEVQYLRDFAFQRHTFMQNHLANFFNLEPVGLKVSTTPIHSGTTEVNGVTVEAVNFTPHYLGIGYSLSAKPKPGFQFSHWSIATRDGELIHLATSGDNWKYFDHGTLPSVNWKDIDYADGAWSQGPSQMGYGDGDEQTLVSFGPSSSNKFTTTYFRRSFNIQDTALVFNPTGSVLYDDGVVVYVNGTEVFRGNMPTGTISNSTFALGNKADEEVFSGFSIPKSLLRNGTNIIAAEVHQFNLGSSDVSFDLRASMFQFGPPQEEVFYAAQIQDTAFSSIDAKATFIPIPAINSLVINEISPSPTGVKDESGEEEDWIELLNAGGESIDIQGLFITDDASRKTKFQLRSETGEWILAAGAYQLLWVDDDEKEGKDHLSFKLSDEGEGVYIYQLVGFDTVLIASHQFGEQPHGFSLARIPNATGTFEFTFYMTPAAPNQQAPRVTNLIINEFSAGATRVQNESGERVDWIEILNNSDQPIDLEGLFISDDPNDKLKHLLIRNDQSWVLSPGSYQVFYADDETSAGANHVPFKLSPSGENIGIYQLTGGDTVVVDYVQYGHQVEGFSSARIPNATGEFELTAAITPALLNKRADPVSGIVINEISAVPSAVVDEFGDHDDWFELLNTNNFPVDLFGLFVTDNERDKLKHMLRNTMQTWVLQPGGYQLLWADAQPEQGSQHVDFRLSSMGDNIILYQVTAGDTVKVLEESFPFQSDGYSLARIPNAVGPFQLTPILTPADVNQIQAGELRLYPNPAQGTVNLLLEDADAVVSVYDLIGNIKECFRFSTPHEAELNLSSLANGVYYVRIQYPTRILTSTLIIAR